MIVSTDWLRDFVDCGTSAEELADRLTMVGLEVEGIEKRHQALERVVTARLEAIEEHPKADRLHLCRVSDGIHQYQVVCGAPNIREGCVVPLALPGTTLPNGMELKETKIRGQLSQGMLCSSKELDLGDDASGIWLLPDRLPIGVPLAKALEIENTVLEIGITPNRGDCLSVLGVAREVAAIRGQEVTYPNIDLDESGPPIEESAAVTIEAADGCPRYAARLIRNVEIKPSPDWMKRRLETVGVRPINNIVDVTNYVMIELGQPLHAFDFRLLRQNRIEVRWAKTGDRFTTLDGVERTLYADTLMICDGEGPVAVAGIMGGLDSEITDSTVDVLIESAYFEPRCIRRSSKKLGLRSESGYRFERGVDYDGVIRAVDRAAQLMLQLAGGELAAGRIDAYPARIEPPELTLRVDRTNRFLGLNLGAEQMVELLRSIEMKVEQLSDNELLVVPPTFRQDVYREVDLTEEIARLVGYDHIPVTHPVARLSSDPVDPHWRARIETKDLLKSEGFFEAITYSFISLESLQILGLQADDRRLDPIKLVNPLSEEQAVMRTSLVPGLLQAARHNFDRGNMDLRIYELSKVFLPNGREGLPDEQFKLVGVLSGGRDPRVLYGSDEPLGYEDVKGPVEGVLERFHLNDVDYDTEEIPSYLESSRSARVVSSGHTLGWLGRLHSAVKEKMDFKSPVFLFELDFDRLFQMRKKQPMYKILPKFPSVMRDVALIVDEEVPVQAPREHILAHREPLLECVDIFDIYSGKQLEKGKRSIGYRIVYRAPDRNLTDEEVNEIHGKITDNLLRKFRATLR